MNEKSNERGIHMKTFWDRIASLYDIVARLTRGSTDKEMYDGIEAAIEEGMNVLDCAAGTGMLSIAAAKKAKHVVCTDQSRNMLIKAVKNARRYHVRNISFAKRDIFALKDPDNRYDAVIAGNVLHLLDDPEKAVMELMRVTKPGGKIILPTYLLGETKLKGKLSLALYKRVGFASMTNYTMKSYTAFIEKFGENTVKFIPGAFPMGFAVITKR